MVDVPDAHHGSDQRELSIVNMKYSHYSRGSPPPTPLQLLHSPSILEVRELYKTVSQTEGKIPKVLSVLRICSATEKSDHFKISSIFDASCPSQGN